MKKILAILAAAATVLGGTLCAAPADAITADLPVEVKVEPYIYLRTYKSLKFVITQQELGGKSTDAPDSTIDYIESNPTPLSDANPDGNTVLGNGKVVEKTVNPLYLVWGARNTKALINVTATGNSLKGSTGGVFATTATMAVKDGGRPENVTLSPTAPYKGTVKLEFTFADVPTADNYTGGKLTISATTP